MAGGPTNTERISALELKIAILGQELKAYFYQMESVIAQLDKGIETTHTHHTSIKVHEKKNCSSWET